MTATTSWTRYTVRDAMHATTCEKQAKDCADRETQQCDDCFDKCSSPYLSDPTLCASICRDICSTSNCTACSAPKDQCVAESIRFDPPPLNASIRDLAVSVLSQCEPKLTADEVAAIADVYGHSYRHEYGSLLECILSKGCSAARECDTFAANGSVGTALCARQRECGASCALGVDLDVATYLNSIEPVLRPALVAELARCSREADCGAAVACWKALQPALGFASYPTQP